MLDLGWLCVPTWRFGGPFPVEGFGHRDDLFRAYERAGGGSVDPAHVRFWEAFGCIKWALMCMHKGLGDLGAGPGRAATSRPSRSAAGSKSRSSTSSSSSPERTPDMPASKPSAPALLDAAIDYLERELLPTLSGYHRF
jgi:hypothetical protein